MNIKNNKRSKESKEKICRTVLTMLPSTSHEITIKEVCSRAGINRTTFYAHYDNIEDVFYQICEEYTIKIYNIFANTDIEYKQRVKQSLIIIKENADFFGYVFINVHNLEKKILEIVESNLILRTKEKLSELSKLSLAYRISGLIGVGKMYFTYQRGNTPPHLTIDDFAELICNVVHP